jgi:hypothetical protein
LVERTQNAPNSRAGDERERKRHAVGLHQDRAGVGADPEVGRVAERYETGVAKQQVQADGEQREDRDIRREKRVEARAKPRHISRRDEYQHGPGNPMSDAMMKRLHRS